jgi:SAM-dependent methyltransferase
MRPSATTVSEDEIVDIITKFGAPIIRDDFENNLGRYEHKLCVERVSKLIPKNARVLDAGCGAGYSTAYLAVLRPDMTIVGYDVYSHPTWKHLSRRNLAFLVAKGRLPFRNEEFDCVVSFGVVEHTNDEGVFLGELNRVLKRGRLNIITHLPNTLSVNEFVAKLFGRPSHEKKYGRGKIRKLLESSGFSVQSITVDYVIPLQVYKISSLIKRFFDKHYMRLFSFDRTLLHTPVKYLGQSFTIVSKKA